MLARTLVTASLSLSLLADWAPLFDGESLAGWRGLGRSDVPPGHWRVESGTIRKLETEGVAVAADGQPVAGGDIITVETYGDFELSFEWKVAPGANSGIKYNVSEAMSIGVSPDTAALGFEYQILDDDRHPDAKNGPNRTAGALYDLVEPSPAKKLEPVGQFNTGRIVFRNGRGEHWLNGEKVVDFDVASEAFARQLARSKYAPLEGFAEPRRGHIVLQDHSDDVWFRNLRIRPLEKE